MEEQKTCPIMTGNGCDYVCWKEQCAWWMETEGQCAVWVIANTAKEVKHNVPC